MEEVLDLRCIETYSRYGGGNVNTNNRIKKATAGTVTLNELLVEHFCYLSLTTFRFLFVQEDYLNTRREIGKGGRKMSILIDTFEAKIDPVEELVSLVNRIQTLQEQHKIGRVLIKGTTSEVMLTKELFLQSFSGQNYGVESSSVENSYVTLSMEENQVQMFCMLDEEEIKSLFKTHPSDHKYIGYVIRVDRFLQRSETMNLV